MVADECKLQSEPNPYYRWNGKNDTPVIRIRREKKSVSLYGGLSMNTGNVMGHQCSWQNSDETIEFLKVIKRKYMNKGTVLLVWDNASWHKSKKIRQWLEENPGIVKLMNFPPYSPDLNPMEHVWKEMKGYLSDQFSNKEFNQIVDAACGYLMKNKFNYKFC